MGRWAQKRKAGGGTPAGNELIVMTEATFGGVPQILVTYSGAVDANDFNAADFESTPGLLTGVTVGQLAANQIEIQMSADPAGETDLTFTGAVTNVKSPDTIAIT